MSSTQLDIKTEEVILENAEYNSAEELDEELQLQLEDSGGESTYHIEYKSDPPQSQYTTQRQQRQSTNSNMNNAATATSKSNGVSGGGSAGGSSGKNSLESEKRLRREIANSNERRRMQSINAGFQNLRSLLPRHEGEKLSKASILQQTSQYILDLENQKTQLLAQNSELKRQLGEHEGGGGGVGGGGGGDGNGDPLSSNNAGGSNASAGSVAIKKRKLTDNVINIQTISDSSDEGLGSMSPEPMTLLNAAAGGTSGGIAVSAISTKLTNATIIAHNAAKELLEMKKQLDKERSLRRLLEDELQMIKRQLYSVATAPPSIAAAAAGASSTTYIPREVIEHTDNFVREDLEELGGTVSYVEIDEMTGQQQVVVCSSIEELEPDPAAEIITEDNVHEEVILSSNSSTESENEVNVNVIAKAYAEGSSPSAAELQPILQAAIKRTPKVEVERLNEKIMKVKTEKIEQPISASASGGTFTFTRSRQNLETIVEAIRHLEGDHMFADGGGSGATEQQQHHQHRIVSGQEAPLALTNKQQQQAQRATLAELRPFLQLKGNKQVTILTSKAAKDIAGGVTTTVNTGVTPTAIFKVQTIAGSGNSGNGNAAVLSSGSGGVVGSTGVGSNVTITTTALKQCRPGVIVAKQLSSS